MLSALRGCNRWRSTVQTLLFCLLLAGSLFAQSGVPGDAPQPVGQLLFIDQLPAEKVRSGWLAVLETRPELSGSAFVGTPYHGWTGLLVKALETMEPERASESAKQLSANLKTGVLHLALTSDGRAWYFYWDSGRLVDRYCSNPGRPGEVPVEVVRAWQGRPDLLLPVARGTPLSKLRSEVSLTDFNGFLYSYYPEMKVERPGSWRTPADLMAMLVQVMGVSHSPSGYLGLKSQPGWTRIAPMAPGE